MKPSAIPTKKKPCVLSIAGSDCSGGAGIQADLKAISATGSYGATVITALTAQNTQEVSSVFNIPATFVGEQIDMVFKDLDIQAVKIGMLNDVEVIEIIAERLKFWNAKNIVLDPVMISKSGHDLLKPEAVKPLKDKLLPLAYLITPNFPEAEKLLGKKIKTDQKAIKRAIQYLAAQHQTNVLLKGGHLQSENSTDTLYQRVTGEWLDFSEARIDTENTHGTGCTLSAAIASYLAQDYPLALAIKKAKEYLTHAIKTGAEYKIGQGHGPVDHFTNLTLKPEMLEDTETTTQRRTYHQFKLFATKLTTTIKPIVTLNAEITEVIANYIYEP